MNENDDAPQVFTRVCSRCSAQATTTADQCPNCGASYMRRGGMAKRTKLTLAASIVVVLIIAGAVVGLVAKHSNDQHDAKVAANRRSAAAASTSAAAAKAKSVTAAAASSAAAASASAAAATTERAVRQSVVTAMQASITKDARKDVANGVLDGPIKKTECTPVAGGSTDLLEDTTGQFSCIAVNKINEDGTESGYRFTATANWSDDSYSWHLGD